MNRGANPREETQIAKYVDWLAQTPGSRVLDAGCGDGSVVRELARRGCVAVGFDVRPWSWPTALSCVLADGARLPFRDAAFDAVGSLAVLEHLEQPVPFLEELIRVLRPGGSLVVACPNMYASILLHPGHSETHRGGPIRYAKNFGLHTRNCVRATVVPERLSFDRLHPDLSHIPPGATDYDAVCATDPAVLRAVLRRNGVRVVHHSPALEYAGSRSMAAVVRVVERLPFVRDLFGGIFVVGRKIEPG